MNPRTLVPALSLLTAATAAFAQDNFSVGGVAAGVLLFNHDHAQNDPATAYNDRDPSLSFSEFVELRFSYRLNDKVTGKLEIQFKNNGAQPSNGADINLEQAYVNYAFHDDWSWSLGKFTSPLGWVAADPDERNRVFGGPITSLYGTEVIGAVLSWNPVPKALPGNPNPRGEFGASLFVVNGWGLENVGPFSTQPGFNPYKANQNDRNQVLLSPGVDLTYEPSTKGSFNLEAIFDPQGGNNGSATNTAGDVFQVGLNATFKEFLPRDKGLTSAFEVIYRKVQDSTPAAGGGRKDLAFMLMANQAIPAPVPMSVTAMYQKLMRNYGEDGHLPYQNELAVALLTNPTGDNHFSLNLELAVEFYDGNTSGIPAQSTLDEAYRIAVEGVLFTQ